MAWLNKGNSRSGPTLQLQTKKNIQARTHHVHSGLTFHHVHNSTGESRFTSNACQAHTKEKKTESCLDTIPARQPGSKGH